MPVIQTRTITRDLVRRNPNTLFVFGDNLAESGLGGQAAEMRGEPNAVGIPTKHAPSMEESAFFTDADFEKVERIIIRQFNKLTQHHRRGGRVVWPAAGVGTGLAQLPTRSPKIWMLIEWMRARLFIEAENAS